MRAAPIPDQCIWAGAHRHVIAAPNGDLLDEHIRPVEALVEPDQHGVPLYSVRCILEPGDLAKLAEGGVVWITFWGAIVPFSTSVSTADNQ